MIRLECDYAEGAHERVLRRLFETNLEQTPGYGEDLYCAGPGNIFSSCASGRGLTFTSWVGGPRPTPL